MLLLRDILLHVSEHFQVSIPKMEIGKSGITTIVGPSGSGKTSILRIIAGLKIPEKGSVILFNRDITNVKPRNREIGYVFQDLALFPHMTTEENVKFGLLSKKYSPSLREERVNELLKTVGLSNVKNRLPHTLSGGEQQRVAIARALAPQPKLLLLDEPFSAIDQPLRIQIRQEIQQLSQEIGIPIILVTHDQEEATAISEQLVYFDEGELIEEGKPEDLYLHPKRVRTAKFFTDNVLVSTNDGIYCFKPWELKLSIPTEKSDANWEVTGTLFFKGKYLITVHYKEENKTLQIEHSDRLQKGTKVEVKIPLENGWKIPVSSKL